jgi:hypothetical protein
MGGRWAAKRMILDRPASGQIARLAASLIQSA